MRKKSLRYLDNDLPEREMQSVRAHLESCQTCLDVLKNIELLWRDEQPVKRVAAPPFLWLRILARLKRDEEQGFFIRFKASVLPLLRPAIIIGALVLVLIGGIEWGNMLLPASGDHREIAIAGTTGNFGMSYFEILPPGSIDARILVLSESEIQR